MQYLPETWLGNSVSCFPTFGKNGYETMFPVCPLSGNMAGNNVSWFAHLWETWLGNNISWFAHLQETWL
jgi:hypothetical protein